jgi:hypothetical protein
VDGSGEAAAIARPLRCLGTPPVGARMIDVKEVALKVTLTEPGIAGSYVVAERRADGALVLMPERERLSDVIAETEGQVFEDQEFIAHLERVARAEDDLPSDDNA